MGTAELWVSLIPDYAFQSYLRSLRSCYEWFSFGADSVGSETGTVNIPNILKGSRYHRQKITKLRNSSSLRILSDDRANTKNCIRRQ